MLQVFERPADLERENQIHGEWVKKFGAVLELSREYALCIGTEFPPRTYLDICNEQIFRRRSNQNNCVRRAQIYYVHFI